MDKYTKLPFPPSLWAAYYRNGNLQVKTPEYRRFQDECMILLKVAGFVFPKEEELDLHVILFSHRWKNKNGSTKNRDLDNYLKCVIDTLVMHARKSDPKIDDRSIFSMSASKQIAKEEFCLVSVSKRCPRDKD